MKQNTLRIAAMLAALLTLRPRSVTLGHQIEEVLAVHSTPAYLLMFEAVPHKTDRRRRFL